MCVLVAQKLVVKQGSRNVTEVGAQRNHMTRAQQNHVLFANPQEANLQAGGDLFASGSTGLGNRPPPHKKGSKWLRVKHGCTKFSPCYMEVWTSFCGPFPDGLILIYAQIAACVYRVFHAIPKELRRVESTIARKKRNPAWV